MNLKLKSTYIEEVNDYPNLEQATLDAARVAEIEARSQGLGTATIADQIGTLIRVVVTSSNREVRPLPKSTPDRVSLPASKARS